MYQTIHAIALRTVRHSDSTSILTAWSAEAGRIAILMGTGAFGSLTVKKAKNTKIIGLQFGRTNFCSYLCSNTRYYLSRVFANL